MKEEETKIKLNKVLGEFGVDASYWADTISDFRQKLELLFNSNRYNKLRKDLFSSKERNEFNSYVFEALFAYDFESKDHELIYEVNQLSDNNTSIDFFYEMDDQKKIYFELRLIGQRDKITQSIDSQLKNSNSYEISLDGTDDRDETGRLQNLILSKCQDKNGRPIKFHEVADGTYNFIVVYVSELYLNMIDRDDCKLAMYGDASVAPICRRNIFGLCQQLSQNAPDCAKKYYGKFEHFRKTIHGVLFVKNRGRQNKRYIDLELEYLLIGNNNLIEKQEFDDIVGELSSFLKQWT